MVSHELPPCFSVFDIFLAQWIMAISKGCKPDNFESHNSLKLYKYHCTSFTNICSLCSNFVGCESFLEPNSPDILALCKAILDDSTDSGNFSVTGYFPLIWKNSVTHIHGLTVYVKQGLPFAWDLSVENPMFRWSLLVFSTCFTTLSVLLLFPLSITFFFFMYGFWFYFI